MTRADTEVQLGTLTTLRVGGPARRFTVATSADELVEAVATADAENEPVLLIGGGSNLLIGDDGFDGLVIQVASRGITTTAVDYCGGAEVQVAAGEPWDGVVAMAVASGWIGLEGLSGIPGSAGATPVQNVGAYGQEVGSSVSAVRTWDRVEGRICTLAAADCRFGYRDSRFKQERYRGGPRYVVLEVGFQLVVADLSEPVKYAELANTLGVPIGTRVPVADVRDAVLGLRRGKGMVLDADDHDTWSAGSFFTNPLLPAEIAAQLPVEAPRWPAEDGRVKTSAAWLIQHAGFDKGHGRPGPASLSTKHTLALTNRGSASAADVLALAREVRDGVSAAFGVTLVPEPELINCEL
jgi:UDP-N-acetylmuramate dehydrogenase